MPSLEWASEHLDLDPCRAVHWPRRATVIIADPHFGKAAAYRHAGVPVPDGGAEADTGRLAGVLADTAARRLVILGDFFHAEASRSPGTLDALRAWRRDHEHLEIVLIRGNHDRHAGDPPPDLRMQCVDEPFDDGALAYVHDPDAADPERPTMAGHLHPAITLRDDAGSSLRCPCFHFTARLATLPPFGSFTGGRATRPAPGDRVFAVGPGAVVEVPALAGPADRRAARTRPTSSPG